MPQDVTFDSQPVGPSSAPPNPGSSPVTFDSQPIGPTGPQPSTTPAPDSLHIEANDGIQPGDNAFTRVKKGAVGFAKRANAVGAGIGQGMLDTASGGLDLVDHAEHALGIGAPGDDPVVGLLNKKKQELQGQNHENPALNAVGYGGETLMEFLSGDAALKGLPLSEQLLRQAKTIKMIEQSPRLMKAVQIGAHALQAGLVQGVQTGVRTQGDLTHRAGEAAVDAAGTAAVGGALGAVTAPLASLGDKTARASQTIQRMTGIAEDGPTATDIRGQLSDSVHGAFNDATGELQGRLDDATANVGMFTEDAPSQSTITNGSKNYAVANRRAVSQAYDNGFQTLVQLAGDRKMPYIGSDIHATAQQLAAAGEANAGALDNALRIGRPGSEKVNRIIDRLVAAGEPVEGGEENVPDTWVDHNGTTHIEPTAAAEGEEAMPPEIGMKHLVEYRQKLSRLQRDLSPTAENYRTDKTLYQQLIDATDSTIGKLSDAVGDSGGLDQDGSPVPSAGRQLFDEMNANYKRDIQPFKNRDVQNIMKGNLNDVAKTIMGGQTSIDDIDAVRKAIGPKNFQAVGQASLQNIVNGFIDKTTGEVDYKKLFAKFDRIDPNVRQAMFGDIGTSLHDALTVANQSAQGLGEIGSRVKDLLGNGDIDTLLNDPERVKRLGDAVGPDGMKVLGQSILQNKIAEAATALDKTTGTVVKTHFDPDKVLDWWMSMKDNPEVRDAFFTADKDTAKHYNDTMRDLAEASSVKKLVKYGVLPVGLGTAGVVHGPGAALIGAVAGLGTEAGFGSARDILDSIANRPSTWRRLTVLSKAMTAPQNGVAKGLSTGTGRAALGQVFHGARTALAGN